MFTKMFSDLYEKAKGPLKQALLSSITSEADDRRARYAKSIAEVKTIWQVDRNVSIKEFYYPTRIDFGHRVRRIDAAVELLSSPSIIVEGLAGQGKSVFMRYLCIRCLEDKSYIPVLLQLRHISAKVSLVDLVLEALNALGIANDKIVIEYFLRRGKVIFLLDGFDEIDADLRADTIRKIEEYRHLYKSVPIVISSRPNSDIQHSSVFEVTRIKPLNERDRTSLISHLVEDPVTKEMLLGALKGKPKLAEVLTTPLLVTLLIITYKAESDVPENLSEFYRALFGTLLKRHDKTKPGYKRQRKTSLGDVEFERVFENLCFATLNRYKLSLTESEYYDFVKEALRAQAIDDVAPESYMDDVVRITCLLVLDGAKYYYLHKSIPEYFAAQKIAGDKSADNRARFYNQLRNNKIPENWYQTIYFLSEIDEYHYVKELLLPYFYKTFRVSAGDLPLQPRALTEEHFIEIVGEHAQLAIHRTGSDRYAVQMQVDSGNWFANTFLRSALEEAVLTFIDGLSEFRLRSLVESNRASQFLDYCFKEASAWPAFLQYLNGSAALKERYSAVIAVKKRIEALEARARPLFELNIEDREGGERIRPPTSPNGGRPTSKLTPPSSGRQSSPERVDTLG